MIYYVNLSILMTFQISMLASELPKIHLTTQSWIYLLIKTQNAILNQKGFKYIWLALKQFLLSVNTIDNGHLKLFMYLRELNLNMAQISFEGRKAQIHKNVRSGQMPDSI